MGLAAVGLLLGITLGVLAPLPVTAQDVVMYDDFNSGRLALGERLDGGLWFPYEHVVRFASRSDLGPDGSSTVRENSLTRHSSFSTLNTSADRRIVEGQLRLHLASAGGTYDDPNVVPGHGRIGVLATARLVNQRRNIVQATVTPMAAEAPACRATGESRVRAQLIVRILESFDVQGRNPAFATLSLERSSFGGDRIYATISHCRDWQCLVIEEIARVEFTRTWTLGRPHRLRIRYQPDSDEPENSRVIFTVAGGGVATEERVMQNAPPDRNDSSNLGRFFDLRVETSPASCPALADAPAERIAVTMDARVDDVRVGSQ